MRIIKFIHNEETERVKMSELGAGEYNGMGWSYHAGVKTYSIGFESAQNENVRYKLEMSKADALAFAEYIIKSKDETR